MRCHIAWKEVPEFDYGQPAVRNWSHGPPFKHFDSLLHPTVQMVSHMSQHMPQENLVMPSWIYGVIFLYSLTMDIDQKYFNFLNYKLRVNLFFQPKLDDPQLSLGHG